MLCAFLPLGACHEPFSNDDILFLKALPSRRQFAIGVPNALTAGAPDPRPKAKYYLDTSKTSEDFNNLTFGVLAIVENAFQHPPSYRDTEKRVWGPFPDRDNVLVLTVQRVRTSTVIKPTSTSTPAVVDHFFNYALSARVHGTGDWLTLFAGRYGPTERADEALGWMYVDLEVARRLKPDEPETKGTFLIGYDTRAGQRTIQSLIDLSGRKTPAFMPNAGYTFFEDRLGNKTSVFYLRIDIEPVPDGRPEDVAIIARFLPDHRGRADVAVGGGDIPPGVYFFDQECWNEEFIETFRASNDPHTPSVGTVDACAPALRRSAFER